MTVDELNERTNQLIGRKQEAEKAVQRVSEKLDESRQHLEHVEEAHRLIQWAACETQRQLEWNVQSLVNTMLESVFGDSVQLSLEFAERRGRTEAEIKLKDSHISEPVHPLDAGGHGIADIMALGLRMVMYKLASQQYESYRRPAPVLVLDEPFKNINDPNREYHELASRVLKDISDKLGIQVLVVTLMPELIDVADRTFEVSIEDGVSNVNIREH